MRAYIEITNVCNLSCDFCPKTSRTADFINLDNFEKIIINVSKITKNIYLHIMGEPLLHPNFFQILDICENHNMSVDITTNGLLLSKPMPKCVHKISISLHSQEQNDIFSNEYIENCIAFAKNRGNTIVEFRLWNNDNSKYNSDIFMCLEKHFGLFEKSLSTKLDTGLYVNIQNSFSWPNINSKKLRDSGYCLALRRQFGVLVDGTVVPCCLDSDGNIPLGNALKDDIMDILQSKRAKKLENSFIKGELSEDLCKKCGYANSRFGVFSQDK